MVGTVLPLFLYLMLDNPLEQMLVSIFSGGDGKNLIRQFFLLIPEFNSVESKENEHRMGADPFISIDKRMIHNEPKTESGSLLLNRRIGSRTEYFLKWRRKRGIEHPLVAKAMGTACFADHVLVEQDDLLLVERFHFASSSYAFRFCSISLAEIAITSSFGEACISSAWLNSTIR